MHMRRIKPFIYSAVYAILSIGSKVLADNQYEVPNPINAGSFAQVVQGFAALLTKIGIPIATVFIIYAGLLFVTARGNDEQLKKAKETFKWTIIGTALLVGAYAIAAAIVDFAQKL